MVGILPALAAWYIRRNLHEPEIFVKGKARNSLDSLRLLVADSQATRSSIAMVIICGVQNFGYYGVIIWLPTYLSTKFGYGLTQSAIWTIVTILGMALGIYVFGHVADRFSRKPTFISWMVGAGVMVVIYSQITNATWLLIAGAVMGFFVNGMLGGYGALMSELYPTAARATAQNVLFNAGRAIGGFGPVVVGAIAASYGFSTAIALLAGLYVIDIIAMMVLIPERKVGELV
ncbi:major facilitator superfamily transporter [Acidiphilium acidophilum DSM 700]|nr:major facilitator superfamily transporter [Acidiphilium acidophilum DSM 700]